MQDNPKIGIIGGSGMEDPSFIPNAKSKSVNTVYGNPSSKLMIGMIDDVEVNIISRHGLNHTINPTNVNYRANILALKNQGCNHILAITACGSLRKKIAPGDFVFPDQFIDRTTKRTVTFFDDEDVKHVPMGEPFCSKMRNILVQACKNLGFKYHDGGTVVTIEGPRFSTRAESMMFRSWGCDIINMSTVPEIVLARELDLQYQAIAMTTDYDCWYDDQADVNMDMIYSVMKKNVNNVKKLIENFIFLISNKGNNAK